MEGLQPPVNGVALLAVAAETRDLVVFGFDEPAEALQPSPGGFELGLEHLDAAAQLLPVPAQGLETIGGGGDGTMQRLPGVAVL